MAVALHRVKFSCDSRTFIEIEWSKGRGRSLSIPPPAPNLIQADEELEPDETGRRGIPALCWRDDVPVLFERFQLRENTEYFIDITLPISMVEAIAAYQDRRAWPFAERLATVFKADPVRRWRANGDGTITVSGQLRLRNHAGILDLSPSERAPLVVEIVCRKIGYFEEFRALLDAVAEEFSELLLQYDSPVSATFNLADVTPETEAALLFQLRHIMAEQNLPVALDEIRRTFHARLEQWRAMDDIAAVEEPDVAAFIEEFDSSNLTQGGPLAGIFRGYSPREFPVIETRETSDTAENRYIKFFLEELRLIAQRLQATLARSGRRASLREVDEWVSQLDEELASDLWRSIGIFRAFPSNSQVLQKRRGYRDILKLDLSLRMSLELPWKRAESLADGLVGDIRPVNELYEYWCFFQLRRTLAELAASELPSDGSLIDVTEGGLQVRLLRGRRSRVSYLYRRDDDRSLRINLFYNRVFPRPTHALASWHGSYTARFDPDYSIEIIVESKGPPQRHWLHFDAKYRLESVELSDLFAASSDDEEIPADEAADYEREISRIYRQDDLFKMHTYRDGILGSRGAYILFPGDGAETRLEGNKKNLFIRHPSAFSGTPENLFPSVGAFDLCPGRDSGQRPIIYLFLRHILETVYAGKPYQEEEGLFGVASL
ncbi:MAG: hypothetical protein B7Z80_26105 [Rhodospirillales bacterium 20-64-7]|nr:MAG: hypothetical protein B7Z80_26105 [Rhodospirillales bacterium 20-64-7]